MLLLLLFIFFHSLDRWYIFLCKDILHWGWHLNKTSYWCLLLIFSSHYIFINTATPTQHVTISACVNRNDTNKTDAGWSLGVEFTWGVRTHHFSSRLILYPPLIFLMWIWNHDHDRWVSAVMVLFHDTVLVGFFPQANEGIDSRGSVDTVPTTSHSKRWLHVSLPTTFQNKSMPLTWMKFTRGWY